MRAVEVPAAGEPLAVVDRERPTPDAEEVLVAVEACGVCRGDEAALEGAPPVEYPRVPGHELAGTVAATGDAVERVGVGDRVAVGWHGGHCGACRSCRRGAFVTCDDERVTGVHHDGGFAEYAAVPAAAVAAVPDGLAATAAAPLACAGLTAYTGLTGADARPGDTVAVLGVGGVGHVAVAFAAALGYETVALSRGPDKRAAAEELGADTFVDTTASDPAAALADRGGADVVLATAPSAGAYEAVLGGLAPGGTVVAVGAPDDPVAVPVTPMLGARQTLQGWAAGHAGDLEDALAAAVRTGVRPRVETYPLAAAEEALADLRDGTVRFRAVLEP
jgi:D-arabinose 1-dehydrogenase-like Zn-dependent alcohol dehydrogenase